MRKTLLTSILLLGFSSINAQLTLLTDSTSYTRCVQEPVKIKFTIKNDTTRKIYFWWNNRHITNDPRNDWRFIIQNLKKNKTPVIQTDLEFRYPRYIIESIRGNPYWHSIIPNENHNLGSSNFGEIINTRVSGEYSFDIGFSYNWGDTLEFVPKGSPDFSWGERDTTWSTIHINFEECSDSIYIEQATENWNKWITNKNDYALLHHCAESHYFNMVDSIIALLEENHNILRTRAGIRTVHMIAGKEISQDQTKKLITGFAGYKFNRNKDAIYSIDEDFFRNRIFALIAANTTAEGSPYILLYQNDASDEIRKSVLFIAAKYRNIAVLEKLRGDSDRGIRQRANGYIKNIKKQERRKSRKNK